MHLAIITLSSYFDNFKKINSFINLVNGNSDENCFFKKGMFLVRKNRRKR